MIAVTFNAIICDVCGRERDGGVVLEKEEMGTFTGYATFEICVPCTERIREHARKVAP